MIILLQIQNISEWPHLEYDFGSVLVVQELGKVKCWVLSVSLMKKNKSSHSLGWKMSLNRNIGEEMRNSLTLSLGVRHSLAYNVHACGWMNYFSYRFL